jgi:hypothetical protein
MKKNTSKKKSKLTLEELKKKEHAHGESLGALAGGILGAGAGGASASTRGYDGDKRPD